MRSLLVLLVLAVSANAAAAQEASKPQEPSEAGPAPTATPANPATQAPVQPPAAAQGEAPYVTPEQVKAVLHKVWLVEYRTNDLLTDVHPENLKISDDARRSFNEALDNLRKALASQEGWRAQFEQRPDSLYLGYQTFMSLDAVLLRMDAVARSVSLYVNKSLGLQYSQAQNQFFDLQQALQPPLEYMLQNQDQLLQAAQTNLAACQNQLGVAMRPHAEPAVPMKNYLPEIKGRGRVFYTGQNYPGGDSSHRAARRQTGEKKGDVKPNSQPAGAAKPTDSAKPPAK